MSKYDHKKIEPKWQKRWEEEKVFVAQKRSSKPKFYCLDMFPYPSAQGLHVGHPEGYTATDIVSRYLRMNGYEVMHPMGWDAFGLPAENYAIKTGVHPKQTTGESIKNFRRQIKSLGFSYDWSREVNTSDPEYYQWTQWLFLELYKKGLAYKKKAAVNWCDSCQTVLANEQVVNGRCERCKNEVRQKDLKQWFFKITDYADELLEDLKEIDWPEPIKLMQRNWIGKSEGSEIEFKIRNTDPPCRQAGEMIKVFTTRADTLYGATYMVLAPEHPLIQNPKSKIQNLEEVKDYIDQARGKSALERTDLQKEKTGVELKGVKAVNPVNGRELAIWVADYVLMDYGTGAIMAVPAHDERDKEFARKYNLEIIEVIDEQQKLINSGEFNGLDWQEAKKKITEKVSGKLTVNYKLKDWLISRQRYWGAPIPIIYCDKCGEVAEENLPVKLPEDVDFKPTGESPLKDSKSFHQVKCPKCGEPARREVDTMDTFVCSSWYFLRYCDSQNKRVFASADKIKYWMPVDLYVGGAEHACMHLIYARFIYKVLKDLGYIKLESKEPFLKLKNQGMILGEDQQKMSKSRGNVINPDEVVEEYGADTLRMYEMFMGAFEDTKPWSQESIKGIRRFLDRVYALGGRIADNTDVSDSPKSLHQTIKKVTEDIEGFSFNTAISQMMIFVNELNKKKKVNQKVFEKLVLILSPFAPHLGEELWEKLGHQDLACQQAWPEYDPELVKEEEVEIVLQINGKVRDKIMAAPDISEAEAKEKALASEKIEKFLNGQKPKKIIFVPGKLVNIVI